MRSSTTKMVPQQRLLLRRWIAISALSALHGQAVIQLFLAQGSQLDQDLAHTTTAFFLCIERFLQFEQWKACLANDNPAEQIRLTHGHLSRLAAPVS